MATHNSASPLGQLAHHLSTLTDPRQARRPVHLLDELLLMVLGTFFTGGRTFVDMEQHFVHGHEDWLRTFMELPGGLPSHDSFGRLAALDARQLEDALRH